MWDDFSSCFQFCLVSYEIYRYGIVRKEMKMFDEDFRDCCKLGRWISVWIYLVFLKWFWNFQFKIFIESLRNSIFGRFLSGAFLLHEFRINFEFFRKFLGFETLRKTAPEIHPRYFYIFSYTLNYPHEASFY
jgi:hypothetical protein